MNRYLVGGAAVVDVLMLVARPITVFIWPVLIDAANSK